MNKKELRAQMARHGDSSEALSKAIGISYTAFSAKINSRQTFRQTEIQKIVDRYGLTGDEIQNIFFTSDVS